ncbi:helix-turn-helix domain-containing protein [Amycolatopsis sp. H20-H5]|uniref:helix-turn-helix domain-containing protein n=1 Tax=Amycolatopsis sp. H20-H5 TaxID=3046309 RepID=UPI002DB72C45|nr:helix-turn-helix domain-containing protein [Amycolatopsis sp. H20-H5]MEC3980590.1 helix-turn-helix domain-containing protein [Amycolatopsis sp. H20-H5]
MTGPVAEVVQYFLRYELAGKLLENTADYPHRGRDGCGTGKNDLMPPEEPPGIEIQLDKLLAERGMTVTELADRAGLTPVNISVTWTATATG